MRQIKREDWESHKNYPHQVLLLGSHENFRRISSLLVHRAQHSGEVSGIESLYRRWKSAMRGHEYYEEHKLYPYLAERWGVSFRDAEAGHEALRERDRDVHSAFRDTTSSTALTDAMHGHHNVLIEHLQYEEDLVIPLLLELPAEEFRRTFG
ncbi:MAG: hemerythrin domain-containing protein [Nannocystales bacterium]